MLENYLIELLGEHISAGLGIIICGLSLVTLLPMLMYRLFNFLDERSDRRYEQRKNKEK